MLFSWYFKGFELLKRYLIKHPTGVDLENLDLEEVDKEMAIDCFLHTRMFLLMTPLLVTMLLVTLELIT